MRSAGRCRRRPLPLPSREPGGGPGAALGIAGVGLIGASIGLRAVECGWKVTGWDHDPQHLRVALERRALGGTAGSLRELAAVSDVLVLAAPIDAAVAFLDELAAGASAPRARLILDVASVKVPLARAGRGLPAFVTTHPIAGSERSGPQAARADLFEGRVWTFDAAAEAALRARLGVFLEMFGAVPIAVANDEHDRIVALTSHLPQLLSVALGSRLAAGGNGRDVSFLCGTGMRSMLRLGASPWSVWRSIVAANAVPLAQEVRRLVSVLTEIAEALEGGRSETLADRFAEAGTAVARLARGPVAGRADFGEHDWDER